MQEIHLACIQLKLTKIDHLEEDLTANKWTSVISTAHQSGADTMSTPRFHKLIGHRFPSTFGHVGYICVCGDTGVSVSSQCSYTSYTRM